ncbi:unnamed protein product [Rotaria sp. Silwood1]|nr:unnamed protein product [Rotaria sp. Silwood1]
MADYLLTMIKSLSSCLTHSIDSLFLQWLLEHIPYELRKFSERSIELLIEIMLNCSDVKTKVIVTRNLICFRDKEQVRSLLWQIIANNEQEFSDELGATCIWSFYVEQQDESVTEEELKSLDYLRKYADSSCIRQATLANKEQVRSLLWQIIANNEQEFSDELGATCIWSFYVEQQDESVTEEELKGLDYLRKYADSSCIRQATLATPLASALSNKWGCRPIGMIGGIIAALSVAASVYAPSIRFMWLLFGFIGGIGMGLVYLPSIVMVGYYFEKKRAIATGIVTAGTGIGSITFGPFSRFLFDKLGWKYGLLILACILSGCALCAAFMRPLKPIRKRRILDPTQPSDANTEPASSATSALLSENKKNSDSHPSHEYLKTLETVIEYRSRTNSAISTKSRQSIKAEDAIRPMYQEDILYPGNVQQLPEYQAQPDLETYVQETTKVPETNKPTAMKAFWDTFLAMTNINVLNDKKMSILCLVSESRKHDERY